MPNWKWSCCSAVPIRIGISPTCYGAGTAANGILSYDSRRQRVVLYDGWGKDGHLGDTWVWDGKEWTEQTGDNPPPRGASRMAYATETGQLVLFGGLIGREVTGETRVRDEDGWRMLSAGAPPPRNVHDVAYDAKRARVVLYGGIGEAGRLDDVWEWDGVRWMAVE